MSSAAIAFSGEAYQTSGPRLMGAMAASEGFLRAFVRYSNDDVMTCYAASENAYKHCIERLAAVGNKRPTRWIDPLNIVKLGEVGSLYHPDPMISEVAWQRRRVGETSFSLTGVTHTTCSDNFMDEVGAWSVTPVNDWDAIICTSQSVHDTVTQVLERHEEFLRERFGCSRFTRPQLPIIPLGVDIERVAQGMRAESFRRMQRAALGIANDEIVFLFFGRLSFHAKAHPLPMYMALEQAAQRTGKKLRLILAGWFANDALQRTFLTGAQRHCPHVSLSVVDGRRADVREQIWFAADIFTSLSDNIQETFGLTPIEAMAAGLPLVISDWDGYRDTVEQGVQGFLVPTTMPAAGAGEELAVRFVARADTYDRYIAHQSQCTAVDVAACTDYYVRLIENPALRKQLGDAGKVRAQSVFSWEGIIHAYQALWRELKARRTKAQLTAQPAKTPWHPLRQDPLALYAGYASQHLTDDFRLRLVSPGAIDRVPQFYADPLANYVGAPFVLCSLEECQAIVAQLARGECSVRDLKQLFPAARHSAVARTIGWLLKCGLAKRAE